MELLLITLLIQMIYFVSQNLHFLVIMFVAMSIILSFVSKEPMFFVGIAMIICQVWYIHRIENIDEGFKKKRKRKKKKKKGFKKKKWKKAGKFIKKNAKYGLLALGPVGIAGFAAIEAKKAQKNKKKNKRSDIGHQKDHLQIKQVYHKMQNQHNTLEKKNNQLTTTIANINEISK